MVTITTYARAGRCGDMCPGKDEMALHVRRFTTKAHGRKEVLLSGRSTRIRLDSTPLGYRQRLILSATQAQ